ncbi:LamG domain-containing protein [Myxococcus sp. RHSTA-1-4]|uniref:LamG domain-containing protein n=1 Tax=Myxococcus sp. RHSTA-1-4 TaxID=2874601 RepID=UPI001CBA6FF7|nr:LamG domain-containing protein [Myxococcus sp. RHSTA-1-4]MBZ4418817.1 LamG domain-containing protein [Myxococcus sp. RHSTA-1-4]
MKKLSMLFTCVLLAMATESTAANADYRFDDGSPQVTDSSGNSNTGVFVGGARYQGGTNAACNVDSMQLNGAGYVSIPNSPSISFAGSFTLSAWVSLDATRGEINVLSKDTTSWFTNYNLHVYNNRVTLAVTFSASASVGPVYMGGAWCDIGGCATYGATNFVDAAHPLGTWRHVTAVYDNTFKRMTVYLDGIKDGAADFNTSGQPRTNSEALQLGRRKSANGALAGRLDEVRLYSTAFDHGQVAGLLQCAQ